jgi:hypothetical protein
MSVHDESSYVFDVGKAAFSEIRGLKSNNHNLKIKSKWYVIVGVSIQGVYEFIQSHWWGQLSITVVALVFGGSAGGIIDSFLFR